MADKILGYYALFDQMWQKLCPSYIQQIREVLDFTKPFAKCMRYASVLDTHVRARIGKQVSAILCQPDVAIPELTEVAGRCTCCLLYEENGASVFMAPKKVMDAWFSHVKSRTIEDHHWELQSRRIGIKKDECFLPETFAILYVASICNAYEQMREPGADVMNLFGKWQVFLSELRLYALSCGVRHSDLIEAGNYMARQFVLYEPLFERVFLELSLGTVFWDKDDRCYRFSNGHVCDAIFRVRPTCTVKRLLDMSVERWDKAFTGAEKPKELVERCLSEEVQLSQQACILMWKDDGVSRESIRPEHLSYMRMKPNPFFAKGMDFSIESYLSDGPGLKSVPPSVSVYPEFKTAFGRWLAAHPGYSPAYYQGMANKIWMRHLGRLPAEEHAKIVKYLTARDSCVKMWDKAFGMLPHAGKSQDGYAPNAFSDM